MNKKYVSILLVSCFFLTAFLSVNAVNAAPATMLVYRKANLEATAFTSFIWNERLPGAVRYNWIYVYNAGDPHSELNWKIEVIYDNPSDTGWITCSPSSGSDLEPEDGSVTVKVTMTASEGTNVHRDAKIKVINCQDSSDYRVFYVQMGTAETTGDQTSSPTLLIPSILKQDSIGFFKFL